MYQAAHVIQGYRFRNDAEGYKESDDEDDYWDNEGAKPQTDSFAKGVSSSIY